MINNFYQINNLQDDNLSTMRDAAQTLQSIHQAHIKTHPSVDFYNTKQLDTILIREPWENILKTVSEFVATHSSDELNEYLVMPFESGRIKIKRENRLLWLVFWTKEDDIKTLFSPPDDVAFTETTVACNLYHNITKTNICYRRSVCVYEAGYNSQRQENGVFVDVRSCFNMSDTIMDTVHNEAIRHTLATLTGNTDTIVQYEFPSLIIYLNMKIREEAELARVRLTEQKEKSTFEQSDNGVSSQKDIKHSENDHQTVKDNRNVIHIGNSIVVNKAKGSKLTRSKILHRKCRKWSVRGHVRHYKSGKTVYIKPFEKGVDRENRKTTTKAKTYIVHSNNE